MIQEPIALVALMLICADSIAIVMMGNMLKKQDRQIARIPQLGICFTCGCFCPKTNEVWEQNSSKDHVYPIYHCKTHRKFYDIRKTHDGKVTYWKYKNPGDRYIILPAGTRYMPTTPELIQCDEKGKRLKKNKYA